mmetsp:Transcript_2269/g.3183  ORF Transcript_2269/g.3183 Transcript_2269/m.3183 type:complete len:222 (+) Transcript_2269:590-1255(+)
MDDLKDVLKTLDGVQAKMPSYKSIKTPTLDLDSKDSNLKFDLEVEMFGDSITIGTYDDFTIEEEIKPSVEMKPSKMSSNNDTLYRLLHISDDQETIDMIYLQIKGRAMNSFCISKNCTINHRGKSTHIVKPGDGYIVKDLTSAFLEPSINLNKVDYSILNDWLETDFPLIEWEQFFKTLELTVDKIDPKEDNLPDKITWEVRKIRRCSLANSKANETKGTR